jgi:hypothetical protein
LPNCVQDLHHDQQCVIDFDYDLYLERGYGKSINSLRKAYETTGVLPEVFTTKESWKAITANKPYEVVKCHKKPGMTVDIWVITLVTDGGYQSEYASYKFQKTDRQLREDKLKTILQ